MIWKQGRFWLITALFLTLNLLVIYFAYPPLLGKLRATKEQSATLQAKLVDDRQFVANLDALNKNSLEINRYSEMAEMALPSRVGSDILLLQLDGLLQAANLSALTVTTPFSQGVAVATLAPAVETPESEVKAGSIGAKKSQPSQASSASPSFTINGDMSFTQMKTLLAHLATLARWHQITALDLSASADKTTGSLTASIFTSPASPGNAEDLDAGFLEAARKVFDPLQTYTTIPNSKTEGIYGRTDPLAPL